MFGKGCAAKMLLTFEIGPIYFRGLLLHCTKIFFFHISRSYIDVTD